MIPAGGPPILERWEQLEGGLPRAVRFAIEVPIRYRAVGEPHWFSGQSMNMSRSGVLFRGDQTLLPETRVEMSLRLPVKVLGPPGAEVVCKGDVVRTVAAAGRPTTLAATITEFRFVRADTGR